MSLQCLSCGKDGFKTDTAVAHHMSQPRSGCNSWLDELIRLKSHLPPEDDPMESDNDVGGSYEEDDDDVYFGNTDDGGRGSPVTDYFPGAAETYGMGHMFLGLFNTNENSVYRKTNLYYLFSCKQDWKIASWLLHSGLSMGKIDTFLSLEMIKDLPLSFRLAQELRGQAEMLPSGPHWMLRIIDTSHSTKSPVILYWHNPLECISTILNHPLFHDQLDFTPHKVYSTAQKLCCVYTEWMTGDDAWNMQSALPQGATLLGTILSSDKTNISVLTGNRVAHPLLVSLANICMNMQLKSSSNSFILTALLPVPKFLHKNKCMHGILADCLIHQCLDIVLKPLEATLHGQFGDSFHHEPRMASTTLAQLSVIRTRANPSDLQAFFWEVQKFRLNGVFEPFWQDWVIIDLSRYFTPKTLHVLHKEFWDHDAKWLIFGVGESEMDFRFSVLQPVTGFQRFAEGITKLKQVTGRCQRDIQCSIIAVSADAAPHGVLVAVRALMDFHYLVQSPSIDDNDLVCISAALNEFHTNKDSIIDAGVRRGKGNKVINNWYIPKLELMQSVVPSIRNSGVTAQWSADVTEHVHITKIKDPARSSNNNNYNPQICCHLDRLNKCLWFKLATTLLDEKQNVKALANAAGSHMDDEDDEDADDTDLDDNIPVEFLSTIQHGRSRPITNHFAIARVLQHKPVGSVPLPITIDDVALKFGLPDLRLALSDFLHHEASFGHDHTHAIGGPRRAGPNSALPFEKVQVWFKLHLQDTEFHNVHNIQPAQTLNCAPPSEPWTYSHYDSIIVNTEAEHSWPTSGLQGHTVVQIRLIFRPLSKTSTQWAWRDQFLTYVHRFDIIGVHKPTTQMHVLKRARQSNGTCIRDVVPISQLCTPINLVPWFGATADNRLTAYNSVEHASELWLNHFWDKSTYFPLSM
ncbi:uncharacterized protein EDB91DRAFT_1237678 [Suillus paluster]|uniref:uncharacterized protein n=1 Tax=Suillus paluster TaxID=48578 RepID=UPI001B8831AB|nr:uncharacterized protein EDB91DRAFT_1237678 [Suillus paluster]KAG1738912.1 hypothetical protein EDB91DRAFT_1237678 [Suillus paluster]